MVGTISKTVTAAATAEAISTGSNSTTGGGHKVSWATIQAKLTNSMPVTVRAPTATSPDGYAIINPGDSFVLWSPASLHSAIDLTHVFIKVAVDGEGVNVIYVQ